MSPSLLAFLAINHVLHQHMNRFFTVSLSPSTRPPQRRFTDFYVTHGLHHTFWLLLSRSQVNARNVGGTAGLISPFSHREELLVRCSFLHGDPLIAIPRCEHVLLSIRRVQSLKGSVCPPRVSVTENHMVLIPYLMNLADSSSAILSMSDLCLPNVFFLPSRASLSQHRGLQLSSSSICRAAPRPTRSIDPFHTEV